MVPVSVARTHNLKLSSAILPAAILAVGLLLSAVVATLTRSWIVAEERAAVERRVEGLHGALVQRLSLYEQSLRAAAAFVRTARPTNLREWAAFVDDLGLAENYPGIPAVAYAPVVRRAQADAFVADVQRQGLPWFRLWPSAEQDIVVPNRFSAPVTPANMRALGFDMYQDAHRRAAMDQARDSGKTAITGRVILKVDTDSEAEPAFIAYTPVYASGTSPSSLEQRRASLLGFTLAPVRVPTLMSFVLQTAAPDALARIYDGSDPAQAKELHVSDGAASEAQWWRRDIVFSNRTLAVFYAFPRERETMAHVLPWVVVGLGAVASLLLAALVAGLSRGQGKAQALADDMTRALRESEARFRAVFDNSVQFQSLLDGEGRLVASNPSALALAGNDWERVAGSPFWEAEWFDVAAERERCRVALAETLAGQPMALEILRHTADGQEMWVDLSFRPVLAENGRVAWVVAEGRDQTERRRREDALNRAVDELTRSNQELERFAHVAAHDLQEPCRTVISYAQLLERRLEGHLDRDSSDFLDFLVGGAHRMRDLVADLLVYARIKDQSAPFSPVACADLVEVTLSELQYSIAEAGAHLDIAPLPRVLGDRTQIAQLFYNLISNALKFRDPARIVHVALSAHRDGAMWEFCVADNGIGIAAPYHHRVFEPFQRLHGPERYPGTGIGLAICRKVVHSHGGRIWVESQEGKGSRFLFTLPVA